CWVRYVQNEAVVECGFVADKNSSSSSSRCGAIIPTSAVNGNDYAIHVCRQCATVFAWVGRIACYKTPVFVITNFDEIQIDVLAVAFVRVELAILCPFS